MKIEKFKYPKACRDETAYDTYHNTKIPDPYNWLEDPDSEETKAFVDAQNAITEPFINACPQRQLIHDRLKQLWDYPKYSCPKRQGNKYYFFKNTGLQNQSVLYVQDSLDGEAKVFLDPNTFSDDGTVALRHDKFSRDGNIYAYSVAASGSDWNTIHFISTETGEKFPEILEKVKFSSIQWTHDNKGIFYCWYPVESEKSDGSETTGTKDKKLYYHRIGTPQSEDVLVVEFPDHPLWRMSARVSECGQYLFVPVAEGCHKNLLYVTKLDLEEGIKGKLFLTQIIGVFEADYEYVTNNGNKVILRTNKNAPNYKLIIIDLDNYEEENWVDLVPENLRNVLDWAVCVDDDKLVICYIEDIRNTLGIHSLDSGKLLKQLPLELGTVVSFFGDKRYSEIFYQFKSFLTPGIIYRLDLKDNQGPQVFRQITIEGFDANSYKTTQVFYPSKDGTKIPMFIVSRNDIVMDGSSPALLYGYGGFNISVQPAFSIMRLVFLQHLNGVLAIPNIRGGGEYGETWHSAGRIFNKQNVFDDFQCAAEYLIENRYTSSKKLIIQGGSNGGLLVGACINQRPDLFGAAIVQVGVLDMLKFHKFTIGHAWTTEYGSSDDSKQFEYLLKYSPLHNVKPPENGGQYPATLLLTADHDDRVVPLHSLKHIATLQHVIGKLPQQTNPLMIRIDVKAGHGRGKPTSKQIQDCTDILCFVIQALNLEFK